MTSQLIQNLFDFVIWIKVSCSFYFVIVFLLCTLKNLCSFKKKDKEMPTFYDIFTLLNAFNPGFMVKDINEFYNPEDKNIDIK